jgi:hypothetical protein
MTCTPSACVLGVLLTSRNGWRPGAMTRVASVPRAALSILSPMPWQADRLRRRHKSLLASIRIPRATLRSHLTTSSSAVRAPAGQPNTHPLLLLSHLLVNDVLLDRPHRRARRVRRRLPRPPRRPRRPRGLLPARGHHLGEHLVPQRHLVSTALYLTASDDHSRTRLGNHVLSCGMLTSGSQGPVHRHGQHLHRPGLAEPVDREQR